MGETKDEARARTKPGTAFYAGVLLVGLWLITAFADGTLAGGAPAVGIMGSVLIGTGLVQQSIERTRP